MCHYVKTILSKQKCEPTYFYELEGMKTDWKMVTHCIIGMKNQDENASRRWSGTYQKIPFHSRQEFLP